MTKNSDNEMLNKLKRLKIELQMFESYVDDSGLFLKGFDPDVRQNKTEDKMGVKEELVENDKRIPEFTLSYLNLPEFS